jgi:ABC-type sugar transport system ATPase subunit
VLFENLSFQVSKGTMLAIVGQSGAGKSTLLHIMAALDRPSAGAVYCANSHVNALSEDAAAEFRNREIGYVWQFHYLLPEFTALENVAMPLLTRGQRYLRPNRKLRAGCAKWDWPIAAIIAPASFPAANSNASPWRGRSSPSRKSCWPMSLPAISTAAPESWFLIWSRDCTASIS